MDQLFIALSLLVLARKWQRCLARCWWPAAHFSTVAAVRQRCPRSIRTKINRHLCRASLLPWADGKLPRGAAFGNESVGSVWPLAPFPSFWNIFHFWENRAAAAADFFLEQTPSLGALSISCSFVTSRLQMTLSRNVTARALLSIFFPLPSNE